MTDSSIILNFIEHYFRTRKTQFKKNDVDNFERLVELRVLNEIEHGYLELDNNSLLFNEVLLQTAEKRLATSLPIDIEGAIKFIDNFESHLKKEFNCERILNSYSYVIRGLEGFILYILQTKHDVDIAEFLFSLKDDDKRENHLFSFENSFFRFLPYSNYPAEQIFKICNALWKNEISKHAIVDFLRGISQKSISKGEELLEYAYQNNIPTYFISDLLIGMYNARKYNSIDKIIDLNTQDREICMFALGRIKLEQKEDVDKVFRHIQPLDFENINIARQQSYAAKQIIENPITPKNIKNDCFLFYAEFITKGTPEIINATFQDIHFMKGNEQEKYKLFHLYIRKTNNLQVINNFFNYFDDPSYIFHLIIDFFKKEPDYRFPMQLFESGIRHGWQVNPAECENLTLDLFKGHGVFGILATKIIFTAYLDVYHIDLLKLDKEEFQVNSINALCKHPVSLDKLLPILLPLRNSPFKNVVKHLQSELSKKVFDSYHDTLYISIEQLLSNSLRDKAFIKPIKKALANYHELKKLKGSIKDLNPYENEKDLIELYYRLEAEQNAKMMNRVNKGKGSFLETMKTVVIVRGNSSKHGDNEPIPLTRIESKFLVDGSSFINPDFYEHNLNSIQ